MGIRRTIRAALVAGVLTVGAVGLVATPAHAQRNDDACYVITIIRTNYLLEATYWWSEWEYWQESYMLTNYYRNWNAYQAATEHYYQIGC